jgi:ketosteroid isomerase-like protein
MRDTDAVTEVVERYLDAVSTLDLDALADTFHPDVRMDLPYAPDGFPRQVDGHADVVAFFGGMPGFVAPLNFHDRQLTVTADGDEVIAEYRSDSRVLATDTPYRNRYISRFRVQDGLIVRFAEYFDPLVLVRALGGDVQVPA